MISFKRKVLTTIIVVGKSIVEISYLMNFLPKFTCLIKISDYLITPYTKGDQNRQWKVLTQSERVKTKVD